MFLRLLLLFILVPLVEFTLLSWIARRIGLGHTLLLVIGTGILGTWLARREGLRCWWAIQKHLARGELPADRLLDGLMILVAGTLLLTPGILTDLLGFALLVPWFRTPIKAWLVGRFRARFRRWSPSEETGRPPHDEIIDVRVIDAEDREPQDEA